MSNSPLVAYTKISPNRTSPRKHAIDTITIHCVVGQCAVETIGAVFAPSSRQASSNYGIGPDGRIGMYCEEKDRSWCTSSAANDHRAVTIEVASDTTHPYAVKPAAYNALIELVADICRRNGIKKLVWSTDKSKRVNHQDGCNMTVHRDYAAKSCPGDYIYSRLGQIAKEVNQKLSGAPAGPFKAYQGQVNADDGLNCRTVPVSGAVLKTFPDGTVLTITKEEGSWGYCGQGWVCLDYINKIASANDPAAKEESIMNGKLFKKMYDEINPTYNTIEEVPGYWRADIQELVDKGIISGSGNGKLGLTHSDCKAAVIAKRIREKL